MRLLALLLLFATSSAVSAAASTAVAESPTKRSTKPAGKSGKRAAPAAAPAPEPPPRGRMELQGAERVSGPLTDIEPTIRRQQPKIEACYEKQYEKDGRLQGVFALELTIAQNGRVKDLEPIKDSVKSDALSGCIMTTARRLVFPRANGKGDTIVRVLINFVPAPPPPPPPPPAPVAPAAPPAPAKPAAPPAPAAATSTTRSASAPGLRR